MRHLLWEATADLEMLVWIAQTVCQPYERHRPGEDALVPEAAPLRFAAQVKRKPLGLHT